MAWMEPADSSAAMPKVKRTPMLSARMPPMDGPHTVAAMMAPTNSAKLRARVAGVAWSST